MRGSVERQQIEAAIIGLEAQRSLIGSAVTDAALAPLRSKLASMASEARTAHTSEQSLKQVTLLFLDVVGSTALSRRLDPEDMHEVVDGLLARSTEIVQSYGGEVLQYAGDCLLAAFGAGIAQEDDTERAVHSGLALLEQGRAHGERVHREHGYVGFDVRVGVHTGSVLLGGGVDDAGSVRGAAVHVAARMEQTAPAGALRISNDTYRHVRGLFDVERQSPLVVKGLDEPMITYLVKRARSRAFRVATRGVEGVATRMIGRDAELEELQDAFKRTHRERSLLFMFVVAEAGLGKSRLLYEFEKWAETQTEKFSVFRGRATPQMRTQPYGLLRDILAWRLQIGDGDSLSAATEKLVQGIAPLFRDEGDDIAQGHAHLLGHLIGLDLGTSKHVQGVREDVKQIRNRAFHAAAQMFCRVEAADNAPVLLLLDDLHYADDGSLDFLGHLIEVNRDVPTLIVGLTRPSLFERRADWGSTECGYRRIVLSPFDPPRSALLADELLKKLPDIPMTLRDVVTGTTDGNPFYMEELVNLLVDEGAIETHEDRWKLIPDKLQSTHVPQTLTGVLQSRLDGLRPEEKLALQQASAIGLVFWDLALEAIDPRSVATLPSLVYRELVVQREEAGLEGVREYAFRHQLLHQVTYDTLLRPVRRDAHAKVGAWLAALTGARANDFLGAAADHFSSAGDKARGAEFYARAAEHASERHAHDLTANYVAKALSLVENAGTRDSLLLRWRLVVVRERELNLLGQRIAQRVAIDELQHIANALADDSKRSEAAWRHCDIALRTGEYLQSEKAAHEAIALAERAGNGTLSLRAQARLAHIFSMRGDHLAAKNVALDGLARARNQQLPELEALFLNALAVIAAVQDDPVANLEANLQQMPIYRKLANPSGEAVALCNLGAALLDLGDMRAWQHLEEGLKLARAVGYRALEPYALICLSLLALRQGDSAGALMHAQMALKIAVDVQDPHREAIVLCRLGDAELALGNHCAAAAAFERAQSLTRAIDHAQRYDAAAGLARVALAQGETTAALQSLRELLCHLSDGGNLDGTEIPQLIRLTCYQALDRVDDPRASEILTVAYSGLQTRATAITDAVLRQSFLHQIPEHLEIASAWACRMSALIQF